ncbi:MAG: sulfite exporter TauE/SafE family protein [Candidatus Dormibacteria bacterium]
MNLLGILALAAAGFAAGAINAVVGSGSLITFPTLLALGYSPIVANVTNTVGVCFGAISAAVGYRHELRGQRDRLVSLGGVALAGGLLGAILLLALPGRVFQRVVPFLVLLAVVLVVIQPSLGRLIARRPGSPLGPWPLRAGVLVTAMYGGYFGAAQGVIFIGVLGIFLTDTLQRINALKNVLGALVNGAAALLFILVAHVAWEAAGVIAVSSILGGQVGAVVARRFSPVVLRGIIVVGGLAVVVKLFASH